MHSTVTYMHLSQRPWYWRPISSSWTSPLTWECWKASGNLMYHRINVRKFYVLSKHFIHIYIYIYIYTYIYIYIYMRFGWISEKTAVISPYSIKWMVLLTETECVYRAVRAESLNESKVNLNLQRAEEDCRLSIDKETWVQKSLMRQLRTDIGVVFARFRRHVPLTLRTLLSLAQGCLHYCCKVDLRGLFPHNLWRFNL